MTNQHSLSQHGEAMRRGTGLLKFCEGSWIIDGDEFDRNMGTVSMLSSKPFSLAARSLAEGSNSNDEPPTAAPTGV